MEFIAPVPSELVEQKPVKHRPHPEPYDENPASGEATSIKFTWGAKEHPGADDYSVMCTVIVSNEIVEDLLARNPGKALPEIIWVREGVRAALRDLAYYAEVGAKAEVAAAVKAEAAAGRSEPDGPQGA